MLGPGDALRLHPSLPSVRNTSLPPQYSLFAPALISFVLTSSLVVRKSRRPCLCCRPPFLTCPRIVRPCLSLRVRKLPPLVAVSMRRSPCLRLASLVLPLTRLTTRSRCVARLLSPSTNLTCPPSYLTPSTCTPATSFGAPPWRAAAA